MSKPIQGLEGLLPSIATNGFIIEENDSEFYITMELSAIDIVDKKGNLFWGKDYDFSKYIRFYILLNTNRDFDAELYGILKNPQTRIGKIHQNLLENSDQDRSVATELALLSPTKLIEAFIGGTSFNDGTDSRVIKSQFVDDLLPITAGTMDNFLFDSRTGQQITDLAKYEVIDEEGRQIYKLPATREFRIEKSKPKYSAKINRKENGESKMYISCYIFSIFDFDELMSEENITMSTLDFADRIGSKLTYDTIIRNNKANNTGFILKYDPYHADPQNRGSVGLKTWFGPHTQYTRNNPLMNYPSPGQEFVGIVGGQQGSHAGEPQLVKRRTRGSKVQDLRALNDLPIPENLAEMYEEMTGSAPSWVSKFNKDTMQREYNLISGTDEVANLALPDFEGQNPKIVQNRFLAFYKNREMRKYSQGNSSLYGRIFLDKTSENYVNYLFAIDFLDLYKKNTKFAKLYNKLGDTISSESFNLEKNMDIISIKLFRRRVSDKRVGTSPNGYPDHEVLKENEIPYLVAEIGQLNDGSDDFSVQISSDKKVNNDATSPGASFRQGTMREISVQTSKNNIHRNLVTRTFTGTDFNVAEKGFGTYQYYVEIDIRDNAAEEYYSKYKRIMNSISYIEKIYTSTYQIYNEKERSYNKVNVDNTENPRWIAFERAFKDDRATGTAEDNINGRITAITNAINEITTLLGYESVEYDVESIKKLINPYFPSSSPTNQLKFIAFLNKLKKNLGIFLEIDNLPSHKYNTDFSCDHMGNDTNINKRVKILNYFPEYIKIDNRHKHFNLAYFGDIFEPAGNDYGIPVLRFNELNERIEQSKRRFRMIVGENLFNIATSDRVLLEPRIYNSYFANPEPVRSSSDFYSHNRLDHHVEAQHPISPVTGDENNMSVVDLKNIQTFIYQSGLFDLNQQQSTPVERKILETDVNNFASIDANTKSIQLKFENMFKDSMRDFSNEMNITFYTDNFPVPTSVLGEIIRAGDSRDFVEQLASQSNLKQQKLFFMNRIKEQMRDNIGQTDPSIDKLLSRYTGLFESLFANKNEKFLTDANIETTEDHLQRTIAAIEAPPTSAITGREVKVPKIIQQYVENPNVLDVQDDSTVQDNYAPHSHFILDSFKEIKYLHNLNIGENTEENNIEEFSSFATNFGSFEGHLLLCLESYQDENLGIGQTMISKVPIATKYVLLTRS